MTGDYFIVGAVFATGLGLIFGSFINAWVWRIETERSIAKGHSMCPHCKKPLKWYDLVPVLSYAVLAGKCRMCRKPISPRYPIVESMTAALFLVLFSYFDPTNLLGWVKLVTLLAITVLLVGACSYDQKHSLLPDVFTTPALALSALYLLVIIAADPSQLWPRLAGIAVVTFFFYGLWRFSGGKAMGDGDIRLAAIMGMLLHPWQLAVATVAGFNAGAVVAVVLLLTGRKKRTDHIAFGPYLIFGLYFGLIFADKLRLY
ncbi:prepilin peptidase [bacterium]|nr:prepilin peptidase [bacterium]